MKYAREIKVGALAVVCILLLIFGFNYLKGVNILNPTYSFQGRFVQLNLLQEQGPVYVKGYKVGQVEKIEYDFTKDSSFLVTISINKDIRLPYGTKMVLIQDGLLGDGAIELQIPPIVTDKIYASGDFLPTDYKEGLVENLQTNLLAHVDQAVGQVDSLVGNINAQLADDHLYHTLYNIDSVSSDLTVVSGDAKHLMRYTLPPIIDTIGLAANHIQSISSEVAAIDFHATVTRVDSAVNQANYLISDIRSDKGTLGKLMNDTAVYQNVNRTVESANELLVDLKTNPKRYVHFSLFGQRDKKTKK